jgi:hypothetical protein
MTETAEPQATASTGVSDSMALLAACPCGKIPTVLYIHDAGQGGKWAEVSGDCCDEWRIEFRTTYEPLTSGRCKDLARDAWNSAPRAANAVFSGAVEK